ncbi:hypothetical protein GJ26_18935, partial [Vibrio cholerae]
MTTSVNKGPVVGPAPLWFGPECSQALAKQVIVLLVMVEGNEHLPMTTSVNKGPVVGPAPLWFGPECSQALAKQVIVL